MFATIYSSSPLVSAAADEIFPNIKIDGFSLGDVTIPATMRAVLYDRLPDGQTAKLVYKEAPQGIFGHDIISDISSIFSDYDLATVENHVFILSASADSNEEKSNLIQKFEGISEIFGMTPRADIETVLFTPTRTSAKVFIDRSRSCSLWFIAGRITPIVSHGIAVLTPRLFDRYFEHDAKKRCKLTDFESRLIREGLSASKTVDTFAEAIREFASRFDFRTPEIKTQLAGFEQKFVMSRLRNLDTAIANTTQEIEEANRAYASLVRKKRNDIEKRRAIEFGLDETAQENELMEYFLANKNLILRSVDDDTVSFDVRTVLANFDSDSMSGTLGMRDRAVRSVLYTEGPTGVGKADRDILYKAIFIDQTVRVWLYGCFKLSMGEETKIGARANVVQDVELSDCCPNPHLYFHGCMGDNQRYALDSLLSGDVISAMEQTIGAVASININESITARRWVDHLFSDSFGRFFEVEDGRRMNFTEVMSYLKEGK